MTDALFDAERYGHSSRAERKTEPKEAPEVVPLLASEVWRLTSKLTPGVVHAHAHGLSKQTGLPGTAIPTYCGKPGVPQTFIPGETVMGCVACTRAGAQYRAAQSPDA